MTHTYTVRLTLTNAKEATQKGPALSVHASYKEANAESVRLFIETMTETYITIESQV